VQWFLAVDLALVGSATHVVSERQSVTASPVHAGLSNGGQKYKKRAMLLLLLAASSSYGAEGFLGESLITGQSFPASDKAELP
jgi:hypothetical protein